MKLNTFNVIEGNQRAHAERFLEILTGSKDTPVHFAVQTGCNWGDRFGSLAENWEWLMDQNIREHANVYVTVQETDGTGRRTQDNIMAGRAVIAESDRGEIEDVPFEPTMIVNSKAGPHLWAVRRPGAVWDADAATRKTRDAVFHAGTDPAVADKNRILRIPGFYHMKDPSNPHLVTLSLPSNGAVRYYDRVGDVAAPEADDEAWQAYRLHYDATGLAAKVPGCECLPAYKDRAEWIGNQTLRASVAAWRRFVRLGLGHCAEIDNMISGGSYTVEQVDCLTRLRTGMAPQAFVRSVVAEEWRDRQLWAKFAWESQQFPPAPSVTAHLAGGWETAEWHDIKGKVEVWLSRIAAFRRQHKAGQNAGSPALSPPAGFDPAAFADKVVRAHRAQLRRAAQGVATTGCKARFDLVKFLKDHDLITSEATGDQIRAKCPFGNENHPHDPGGAVFNPTRKRKTIGFHCFHATCLGLKWRDVVEHYGADVIAEYSYGDTGSDAPPPHDAGVSNSVTRLGDQMPEVPWPDLVVPKPWVVTTDGVFRVTADGVYERVAHGPVVISAFARAADRASEEYVTVSWYRAGRWTSRTVPRGVIASDQQLVHLAEYGCPVHTAVARRLVNYLADFEAANVGSAPTQYITKRLGWQTDGSFLIGNVVVRDGVVCESDENGALKFIGDETVGDLQESLSEKGSYARWLGAVEQVVNYPAPMFMLYAGLTAALLDILRVDNFFTELCGITSVGKTTSLRLAASLWGSADIRCSGTLLRSWDATTVGLERLAASLSGLPLLLDDTQRFTRRPEELSKAVYQLASGTGRVRGDKIGMRATVRWRTVVLSTGERPLGSYSPGSGGDKARVLSIWGAPFDGDPERARKTVIELNQVLNDNYGFAGQYVIAYIQESQKQWPTWVAEYRRDCAELADQVASNPVAVRLSAAFCAVRFAARVAHEALGWQWDYKAICSAVWVRALAEASTADPNTEAFRDAYSFAVANRHGFWAYGAASTGSGPTGGWLGRWDEGGTPALTKVALDEYLASAGYSADATRRIWNERGWIEAGAENRGISTRLDGSTVRCIRFKQVAVEQIVGVAPADAPLFPQAFKPVQASEVGGDRAATGKLSLVDLGRARRDNL